MARVRVTLLVCDFGDGREAQSYNIAYPDGSKVRLDLCEEHGGTLEDLRTKADKPSGRTRKAVSLEEAEREASRVQRAARKKLRGDG